MDFAFGQSVDFGFDTVGGIVAAQPFQVRRTVADGRTDDNHFRGFFEQGHGPPGGARRRFLAVPGDDGRAVQIEGAASDKNAGAFLHQHLLEGFGQHALPLGAQFTEDHEVRQSCFGGEVLPYRRFEGGEDLARIGDRCKLRPRRQFRLFGRRLQTVERRHLHGAHEAFAQPRRQFRRIGWREQHVQFGLEPLRDLRSEFERRHLARRAADRNRHP